MIESTVRGFIQFIREQGVMGLAIGFVLGGAISGVVESFSSDIVNPLVGALIGTSENLSQVMLGPVALGNFVVALIDFIILAAVVYFVFKVLGLNKIEIKKR